MNAAVMVPLDGSPLAEQALPLAIGLARHLESHLLLLRVISPEAKAAAPQAEAPYLEAKHYLGTLKHLIEKVGVSVMPIACEGAVGESIVGVANERSISHLVMSTHGRTGLMRWTLGGVTNTVLQLTHQPLLLVRPSPDQYYDLLQIPDIRRIVVALDGSSLAESSLPHVRKLARIYQAELLLFRAVTAEETEIADAYLERIATMLYGEGFRVRYDSAIAPPAEAIQTYAQQAQAEVIAMATHMRKGVGRAVLGSITDQVVRLGQAAVLVTHHSPRRNDEHLPLLNFPGQSI